MTGGKESLEKIVSKIEVAAGVGLSGLGFAGVGIASYLVYSAPDIVPYSKFDDMARSFVLNTAIIGSTLGWMAGIYLMVSGWGRLKVYKEERQGQAEYRGHNNVNGAK